MGVYLRAALMYSPRDAGLCRFLRSNPSEFNPRCRGIFRCAVLGAVLLQGALSYPGKEGNTPRPFNFSGLRATTVLGTGSQSTHLLRIPLESTGLDVVSPPPPRPCIISFLPPKSPLSSLAHSTRPGIACVPRLLYHPVFPRA